MPHQCASIYQVLVCGGCVRRPSRQWPTLASSRHPNPSTTTQFLQTQTLPMLQHAALLLCERSGFDSWPNCNPPCGVAQGHLLIQVIGSAVGVDGGVVEQKKRNLRPVSFPIWAVPSLLAMLHRMVFAALSRFSEYRSFVVLYSPI